MSDKPIGVGDLVYVWKWDSCGCGLGITGFVDEMSGIDCTACRCCGAQYPGGPTLPGVIIKTSAARWAAPSEWVRRIPPQEELEGKKTQEPTIEKVTLTDTEMVRLLHLMFPL
jgi:hypothetical protein